MFITPAIAYLTGFYTGYAKAHPAGAHPKRLELGGALFDAYLSELGHERFREVPDAQNTEKPELAFKIARATRSETKDGWQINVLG